MKRCHTAAHGTRNHETKIPESDVVILQNTFKGTTVDNKGGLTALDICFRNPPLRILDLLPCRDTCGSINVDDEVGLLEALREGVQPREARRQARQHRSARLDLLDLLPVLHLLPRLG